MGIVKKVGIGFASLMAVDLFASQQEQERRASLTPRELAAEDSARKASQATEREAEKRTPAYQLGLAHFALKKRAKDPDAAKFRNETVHVKADTVAVCGPVNMKNGFSGYAGFQPYVMVRGAVIMESDASEVGDAVVNRFVEMCKWPRLLNSST